MGCKTAGQDGSSNLATSPSPPNIIYILVDDMGYGDLGSYGQKVIPTPNLDKMAAEGMMFTQHYAGSTVCAPSRGSLMTGMHSGHGKVRGNYETGPFGFGGELALESHDQTIAEILSEAGYRTGLVGKWGLGMNGTSGEPTQKGFDYYFGFLNQAHAHWQYPEYLFRNGEKVFIPENREGKRENYTNDMFTEEAIEFIQKKDDNPFFLYLAYTTPHAELLVPEDSIFNLYKGKFDEKPFVKNKQGGNKDGFGTYASQDYPKAAYATMVHRIDMDVKKILDQLKAMGIDENTVVMFSSDNGPHKEGGAHPSYFDSNGPLRGMKRDLYEGGIRVPLIVRWPQTIAKGTKTDHISGFWDVLPTLAEVANIDVKNIEVDGISFYPTLVGQPQDQMDHAYMYWEFHEDKYSHQAIRKEKWKAVRLDPNGAVELYNLETDLAEAHNVADQYPNIADEMGDLMDDARTPHPVWPLKASASQKLHN
ncbi:MAG: arylsulfatase [Bacteroidota bacterium]